MSEAQEAAGAADALELARRVRARATEAFGSCGPAELRPLPGGHSGLTWRVELSTPDGVRPAVVKSTPPGRRAVGRHDVRRQARVLRLLSARGEVVVPQVYFEDAGDPPFFAMEWVAGASVEPVLDPGAGLGPAVVAELWDQAIALLARLHAPAPADIPELRDEPPGSPSEETARWARTMAAGGRAEDPRAPALGERLAATAPPAGRHSLLHGDYRLGNMLCARGQVLAVIDWEIWSVGDPRCDLGWLALFCDEENFGGLGQAVPGSPKVEAVIARYTELAGGETGGAEWFRALACFKLAAVQAHNLARHRDGRRHDPYLEQFAPSVDRLIEAGLECLGQAKIRPRR